MSDEQDPLARYGGPGNAYDAQFDKRIEAIGGQSAPKSSPMNAGGSGAGGWGAGAVILAIIVVRLLTNLGRDSRSNRDLQPQIELRNLQRSQEDWDARQRHLQQFDDERLRRLQEEIQRPVAPAPGNDFP